MPCVLRQSNPVLEGISPHPCLRTQGASSMALLTGFLIYRLLVLIFLGTEFCGSQNQALLDL